jgi:hypothetical protein
LFVFGEILVVRSAFMLGCEFEVLRSAVSTLDKNQASAGIKAKKWEVWVSDDTIACKPPWGEIAVCLALSKRRLKDDAIVSVHPRCDQKRNLTRLGSG